MTLKQKVLSVFELVRGLIGKRAARTELAAEFSAYEKYDVGRLVVYEDELYRCVTAHTGIWNKSDFEKATVDSALQLKDSGGITEIPNPLELADDAASTTVAAGTVTCTGRSDDGNLYYYGALSDDSLSFTRTGHDGSEGGKVSLSIDSLTLKVDSEDRVISLDTLADIVSDYVAANKDLEEIA